MNTKICSCAKLAKNLISFLFLLPAVLVLASCFTKNQAEDSSCSVDMDMRVTIDVTDVDPMDVFNQLAAEPDCAITVSSLVSQRITLQMENAPVSEILAVVCKQIDCKYTFDGKHLSISPLTASDKKDIKAQEEWQKKFEVRMPQGMVFEDALVSSVLEDISEISGLEFKAWEAEGDLLVSVDISGMTVDEALTAVVLQIEDSEGIVLVNMWDGSSFAQHRLIDKP